MTLRALATVGAGTVLLAAYVLGFAHGFEDARKLKRSRA